MFCTECGNKIEKRINFCTRYGTLISSGQSVNAFEKAISHTLVAIKKRSQNLLRLMYSKVRLDKVWHRLLFVFGWLISLVSLASNHFCYVLWRGATRDFFIVYGENTSKWLVTH